jgi:hypothetical protein
LHILHTNPLGICNRADIRALSASAALNFSRTVDINPSAWWQTEGIPLQMNGQKWFKSDLKGIYLPLATTD